MIGVHGMSVIESSQCFSEVYLVPEILTKLSLSSVSSSVCAETGAPDIVCDGLSNNFDLPDSDTEQTSSRHVSVYAASHDGNWCPCYLRSTIIHVRSGCEIILNSKDCNQNLMSPLEIGIASKSHDDEDEDKDVACFMPSSIQLEQTSQDCSSISVSNAFSIEHQFMMLDFGLRATQENIARRRRHPDTLRDSMKTLSIIATTPSRYQRPVDTLLISHKHPSPIYTNADFKNKCNQGEIKHIDNKFSYENFDPQSPLAQKGTCLTTKNQIKASNIHPLSPSNIMVCYKLQHRIAT